MKHACRYAIIRFLPYAETEEFANIGVVLVAPSAKYFGFRMMERGLSRITTFFGELDAHIFKNARKTFLDELERIKEAVERSFAGEGLAASNRSFADFAFNELTRTREAIIQIADSRGFVAEDPAEALNDLYARYIGRAFVTRAYQEREVEKRVHAMLRAADLTSVYREQRLGNDSYHARFPFVKMDARGRPLRVIKPLDLAQPEPMRIYDHGWDWLGKVKKLRKIGALRGELLIAAEEPNRSFAARHGAYAEVVAELEQENIRVVPSAEQAEILRFATA